MVNTIKSMTPKSAIPQPLYVPSAFILGMEKKPSNEKAKGVFLKLPTDKLYALQQLKTRMDCQTWEEFTDCLLYLEETILIDLRNFREQASLYTDKDRGMVDRYVV